MSDVCICICLYIYIYICICIDPFTWCEYIKIYTSHIQIATAQAISDSRLLRAFLDAGLVCMFMWCRFKRRQAQPARVAAPKREQQPDHGPNQDRVLGAHPSDQEQIAVFTGPGRHVWCAGRWLSESTSSPPSSCKVQGWTYVIVSFELRVFFGKGGHAAMYLWHFVQDHDFWRVVCSQCWSATKDIKRHPEWAGCEREMKAWGNAHTGQRLWFCINKGTDY